MRSDKLFHQSTLKNAGLKVTPQRISVLEAVMNLKNHPSADEIYAYIKKEHPSVAIGTLYKTLESFVNKKILRLVKTEKGAMLYDPVMENHHHLYCSESERIDDYYDTELDQMLVDYFNNKKIKGFNIEEIRLQLLGKFSDK